LTVRIVPWPKKESLQRQVAPLPNWLNPNLYYKSDEPYAEARRMAIRLPRAALEWRRVLLEVIGYQD